MNTLLSRKRILVYLFLPSILLATIIGTAYTSQVSELASVAESKDDNSGETYDFTPNDISHLIISIPKLVEPPKIDGELEDSIWRDAIKLDNFAELNPGDNIRPEVNTEAFLAYDDQNLYAAFICYDDNPDGIRATLTDRDEIFSDDFIGIVIDTFNDNQSAYEFFVNPHGIQGDLRIFPENEDSSFDTVWKSGGKITSFGWTAEFAIPFRSLRFPNAEQQEWGIHVTRIRPRASRERFSWAPVSRDESCYLCQAGTLNGIKGVSTGNNIELLPYVIGNQSGSLKDEDDPALGFEDGSPDGTLGLGLKYGLTPNLTLDLALNPDFSQVESDAAQIDVNTTFALFFPERRPFFLEGSDIFDTKIDAVYTRSINDPAVAAKLTGKIGKYTVGYIFARDDETPFTVPFEESSEFTSGGKSISNVVRIKRDLLSDSFIGFLATDRRLSNSDGSNSTFGVDGRIRFAENYRLAAQFLGSHSQEPNDAELSEDFEDLKFGSKNYTSFFDGESFLGEAFEMSFSRSARHWNFWSYYEQYSPTFRADDGFKTSNNYREAGLWTDLWFRPNKWIFDDIEPQLDIGKKFNYDGVFKDSWFQPSIWIRFKKQTSIWTAFLASSERFDGILFEGIKRFKFNLDSQFSQSISGGFWIEAGRFIARNRDDDDGNELPPILGHGRNFSVWSTLKPTQRLKLVLNYDFSKLLETPDGPEEFSGYVLRLKTTYQFSKSLFLRVVTQYNDFSEQIEIDPLLSYKINPFTLFFVGSTHDVEKFHPEDYEGVNGFMQTDRQFFMKFQYLIRI